MSHPEKILCVEKRRITTALGKLTHGVHSFQMVDFIQKVQPYLEYRVRDELEKDDTYLQLIPVIIVPRAVHNPENNDLNMELVTYRRAKDAGESRLLGKLTTNFGGHIEECDCVFVDSDIEQEIDLFATLENCVKRELQEELGIRNHSVSMDPPTITTMANSCVIVDHSDEVGRVHLGFLYSIMLPIEVEGYSVIEGTENLGYLKLQALQDQSRELDGWARLIVRLMLDTETQLNATNTKLPN